MLQCARLYVNQTAELRLRDLDISIFLGLVAFCQMKSCVHWRTFHAPGWVPGRRITKVHKSLLLSDVLGGWARTDRKYQSVVNTVRKQDDLRATGVEEASDWIS